MSRLAADHRTPAPRDRATHLHRPLQPRAPSPRTRTAPARTSYRHPTTEHRQDRAPRPTRRTDPRIPPRRSMNRHFETPHGIASFDRLVWQVMTKEPYASARRVFWIVDNGSSHRGDRAVQRLERRWPNHLVLVHLPVHARWLNQIEIYFSIVQRKVLEPNDFENLADVARTLNAFEGHWNAIAEPFDWNFSRDDLAALIERLAAREPQLQLAA